MAVIGNSATQQAFTPAVDYFSGNASTTAFTLSRPVASVAQVEAVIDNVVQNPSSAYTVSGNTITFTSAPLSGTNNIYVRYTSPITQVIAPGQGTVNTTALAGGTVTTTADATLNGLTVGKGAGANAYNTTVGSAALAGSNTGANNTAIGYGTLFSNTSGASGTAVGTSALLVNSTGSYNTAVGHQALTSNTTASNNTAVGYQAGYTNSTGGFNTFIGYQAGYSSNYSGNAYNTCVGGATGFALTTGYHNTLIGYYSGAALTTGSGNTFVGNYYGAGSGALVTTGSKNTILGGFSGNQGGLDIRTASNYIVLSDGDGNPRGYFDNSGILNVGNTINAGSTTGTVGLGVFANFGSRIVDFARYQDDGAIVGFKRSATVVGTISVTGSATAYNTSSDYRLKQDIAPMTGALAKVALLKPVTYKWKADGSDGEGFIAHELQAVVPDCVTGEKDAVDADGNPVYQGIDTSFLVATLTAAIQELKALVDAQATEIAELKAKVGV